MKRLLPLLLLVTLLLAVGCQREETYFDSALLPGTWVSGTEYWAFTADGLGHTWDTADDVTEDEAQQFTWALDGSAFQINHIGEMGEVIPKTYTMTRLTSTELAYRDAYGNTFSFRRLK